jgi:hypothetical protein
MTGRTRLTLTIVLAGALAVLGLSGCGQLRDGQDTGEPAATDEMTDFSWDAQALQSIGFAVEDLPLAAPVSMTDPGPTASTEAQPGDRRGPRFKRLRWAFHRNVLHGEAVVTTEEGTKTVVVQRGTVTAIDGSSITVKSADGFTLTWTFGDPMHVVEHRMTIEPSVIAVGTAVGVAGAKDGDATVARLIVVPRAR